MKTKHLSTNADSSTDTIGGWTKAKSSKQKLFFARRGQSGRIGTMRDGGTLKKYFFETKKFHIFSLQINLSTL